MEIVVAKGDAAEALLKEKAFLARWEALQRACPWATAFQSPAYVATWYPSYRGSREPLLVFARGAGEELVGLLCLAINRKTGAWQVAGAPQAEYQTWLALPSHGDSFIGEALRFLADSHGLRRLAFRYLPQNAPLTWARRDRWRYLCAVDSRDRPLMALDNPAAITASLKKSNNRSRYNRLKRKGNLSFAEVKSRKEFARLLSDLEAAYDLRMAALHGHSPFRDDSGKREFYSSLIEIPNLIHVAALQLDGRALALHVGVLEGDVLCYGFLAHSPFEAANSPGKILILLIAQMLSERGFRHFDFTPGLDPWKERFATHRDRVTQITLHANALACIVERVRNAFRRSAVELLRRVRIEPWRIRTWIRNRLTAPFGTRERQVAYCLDVAGRLSIPARHSEHARDQLKDLLAFDHPDKKVRQRFLRDALTAIEGGRHVYTLTHGGRLAHFAWLDPEPQEPKTALIGGFFAAGSATLKLDAVVAGLEHICMDAVKLSNVHRVRALVCSDDQMHRAALEVLGFQVAT